MLQAFKSLHLTFYSIPFYRDLLRNWKGIGLSFLLAATLLNLAQAVFSFSGPVSAFLKEKDAIFEALPALSIKNNQISVDAPMPFEVKFLENREGGPFRIVFDTAKELTDKNEAGRKMGDENIFVLVSKNAIFIHDRDNQQTESTTAADLKEAEITHEKWKEIGDLIVPFFFPLFAISSGFFLFFSHLGTAVLGGLLLFAVAPLFKIDASFKGSLRIAAAAKIPVAALLLLAPALPLINLLLWFGFAAFGLLSSRKAPE